MSYPSDHTDDSCDVCLKTVGKKIKVPFLYLDRNDHTHPDAFPGAKDYKQYYACEACFKKGV